MKPAPAVLSHFGINVTDPARLHTKFVGHRFAELTAATVRRSGCILIPDPCDDWPAHVLAVRRDEPGRKIGNTPGAKMRDGSRLVTPP